MGNIFDMTQTIEIGNVLYERIRTGLYRGIPELNINKAFKVTDKKLIERLNKVFKDGTSKRNK